MAQQTNEPLRVGIIGVGNIGTAHAKSIFSGEIDGMVLTALCDIDEKRRECLADAFPNIPCFADHKALLASELTDVIVIATPHRLHPTIAEDAFRHGKHVLSEKPAGVDCKSVMQMYEVARSSGKAFGIMFNQRTDPLFAKARELVSSGKLGEPKRLVWIVTNWYRKQSYYDSGTWRATWNGEGGGVLLNQAPHNLDLWQWIFGMPKRLRAFCYNGKYHHIDVEDDAAIYAEYENGATATFMTSTGEYPGTNRLEISGDLGKLVIERGELCFYSLSSSERDYCFSDDSMSKPTVEKITFGDTSTKDGHIQILQNFADHIRKGAELIAPGTDGIYELMLTNAAYLSSHYDTWEELPADADRFLSLLEEYRSRENEKTQEKKPDSDTELQNGYSDRWKVKW